MKLRLILCAVCLTCVATATAGRPRWMHRLPSAGNPTYTFVPITVEANGLADGRTRCLEMLSMDRGLLSSLRIRYSASDTTTSLSRSENNAFSERIDVKTVEVTTFEGKPMDLQAQIVDEYYDAKHRQLSTLYRVGVMTPADFDALEVTDRYGCRGLWRSALVPGWGQFYKGSPLKGSLLLGGAAVMATGIVFAENQRADYDLRIRQTHNASFIRSYQTKRDRFATARNIGIGAAAALYVYNVIDAIVAPGARRVVVGQRAGGRSFVCLPSVTDEGAPMLQASITF